MKGSKQGSNGCKFFLTGTEPVNKVHKIKINYDVFEAISLSSGKNRPSMGL
jgi:hypothetical protein